MTFDISSASEGSSVTGSRSLGTGWRAAGRGGGTGGPGAARGGGAGGRSGPRAAIIASLGGWPAWSQPKARRISPSPRVPLVCQERGDPTNLIVQGILALPSFPVFRVPPGVRGERAPSPAREGAEVRDDPERLEPQEGRAPAPGSRPGGGP